MPLNDEQSLVALLRALPPAPQGWAEAAHELPRTRGELDDVIERIERDERFRAEVHRDIERALEEAGITPDPRVLAVLRARLAAGDGPV